jgi:acyl carrier protein
VTEIERKVKEFINANFLFGARDVPSGEKDSFLEMGIIDSTGVLEIVNFIETTFGINIADDELNPDNLDSVPKIVRFINRKVEGKNIGALT